jgi:hypothetical protein
MSFKDWITYLIEKMVWYMETPRTERKAQKQRNREPWSTRWFGMIPFSIKIFLTKQKGRFRRVPQTQEEN